MKKSYSVNGVVYNFTDVQEEGGRLLGRCTTNPRNDQWAWLDPNGFQFIGERRVEAFQMPTQPSDSTYTLWGGQLRDKLPHGARYYINRRINHDRI